MRGKNRGKDLERRLPLSCGGSARALALRMLVVLVDDGLRAAFINTSRGRPLTLPPRCGSLPLPLVEGFLTLFDPLPRGEGLALARGEGFFSRAAEEKRLSHDFYQAVNP